MKRFEEYNPFALFIYYAAVTSVSMFSMNPVSALCALLGALSLHFFIGKNRSIKTLLYPLLLFVIFSLANPIFSHNGKTVLFVMNNNPVTLEAFYYGAVMGLSIVSVLCQLCNFSAIMTSDKLLYVFGLVSPKLALILSMALRYIPLFREQARKTDNAQRAMGLYKDENIFDRLKGSVRVFSIVLTLAIENGITTADSMASRGYGTGRRTSFAIYRFRPSDIFLLISSAVLFGVSLSATALGATEYVFYPVLETPDVTVLSVSAYISYALLCFLPLITQVTERLRWKFLQSKICASNTRCALKMH